MTREKIEYLKRLAEIRRIYGSYKNYLQQLTGLADRYLRHVKD